MESHFRYEERQLLSVLETPDLDVAPTTPSDRCEAAGYGPSRCSSRPLKTEPVDELNRPGVSGDFLV
jgi:hypothetical protein